ncbi:MAG: glycosyltransferase family 39 protein [Deltaproteobacteria bacterium]|nr:glycosyltransferase family 39 protein [Deltaproteobacteria bacterium]
MALFRLTVTGLGVLLLALAALVDGPAIERALLGQATGALSWGPALFRLLCAAHGAALLGAAAIGSARQPASALPARDRRPWLLLTGLSVVALVLRCYQLNSCLWFDEVLTLVDFVRSPLGQIVTTFPSQNQHMLFSILAHASISIFGESAWALRLPSVVFGVASLWALFLLGRRIAGTREALLACAVLAVSYHHVWFSQNARGYMGLMFFSTLATWLWLRALESPHWRWPLAYALTVALGMWIHMTMLFVPAAHGLLSAVFLLRTNFGARRTPLAAGAARLLAAGVLALTLTLQLYALALPQFFRTALHEVSLPSEWTNPLWVVTESLRSLRLGFGLEAILAAGAGVALTGWLSLTRRNWLAGFALVLPAVMGGAGMLVLGHNLWPRFFFFAIGFALLIAVHGTMSAARLAALAAGAGERAGRAVGTAVVGLLIVASLLSLPRAYALPKQDFAGARHYVEQRRGPGDAVVAVGLAGVAYQRYFAPHWQVAETGDELEALRRAHPGLWLVYTLPIELKAYRPEIWEVIERDFEIAQVFPGTLGDGAVNVCRARRSLVNTGSDVPGAAAAPADDWRNS